MIRSISYEQSAYILAQREREERERRERKQMEREKQEGLLQQPQLQRGEGLKKEKSSEVTRLTGDARPGSHRALSENYEPSDSIVRMKSSSRNNSKSDNSTPRLSRSSSNSVTDALSQALDELHTGLTPRTEMPMTKAQIQERAKEMLAQGCSPQEVEAFILEQGEIRKRALEAIRREKEREASESSSSAPSSPDKVEKRTRSKPSIKVMSKDEIKEKARAMLASGVPNEEVLAFIKEQQDIRDKLKAAKKDNR